MVWTYPEATYADRKAVWCVYSLHSTSSTDEMRDKRRGRGREMRREERDEGIETRDEGEGGEKARLMIMIDISICDIMCL